MSMIGATIPMGRHLYTIRKCVFCFCDFAITAYRGNAKTCSNECRDEYWRSCNRERVKKYRRRKKSDPLWLSLMRKRAKKSYHNMRKNPAKLLAYKERRRQWREKNRDKMRKYARGRALEMRVSVLVVRKLTGENNVR